MVCVRRTYPRKPPGRNPHPHLVETWDKYANISMGLVNIGKNKATVIKGYEKGKEKEKDIRKGKGKGNEKGKKGLNKNDKQ